MLTWTFAGIATMTDGSWTSFMIVKDEYQVTSTGPNFSRHPTVVDFLTNLGLNHQAPIENQNISDITFRLSVNDEQFTLGGTEDAGTQSDSQASLIEQLNEDPDYKQYFNPYNNDGPTLAQAIEVEFGTCSGPWNFEANTPLWAKFTPDSTGSYVYVRLYSGASPPPNDPATDIATTFYNADGTLITMDVDNDPGPNYLSSWGDNTQFENGTVYYARIVVNKRSSLNLRVDYD